MSRLTFALGAGMSVLLIAAVGHDGSMPGHVQRSSAADTCSVESLARAAAVDTARLRRVERDYAPGKSAEGGETTIYYEGDTPRAIVITYYGETGKTVVRYYLAAPDQFLVEQEVIEYAEPISIQSKPVIASRLPSTVYICGATVIDPVSQDELREIRSDVRAVLAQPSRAP